MHRLVLFISLLLLAARSVVASVSLPSVLNDHLCTFNWTSKACSPSLFCSFQYEFGDVTFNQSCRLDLTSMGKTPMQLHLAYAGTPTGSGMAISWTTYTAVVNSTVWLGTSSEQLEIVPSEKLDLQTKTYYTEGKYSLFHHHAVLSGLKPHTKYFYKVGSKSDPQFQSVPSFFTTARTSSDDTPFKIALYGDFGVDANANDTMQYINAKLPSSVDFIYHIGDISYADNAFLHADEFLGFFYEETYNRWMDALTPTMQSVPYMVSVGNHEAECHSPACFFSGTKKDQLGNYSAYNTRFRMPSNESGGVENMWYSFEYGPVHFTSISSETDYTNAPKNSVTGRKYGNFGNQLAWLEADLKKADANRKNTPWLIVSMHRAIYTRQYVDENGNPSEDTMPVQKAFEDLFIKYNVDVVLAGHVHLYERQLPVKKGKVVLDGVSSDRKLYTNPKAPVYLVTGSAGNTEGLQTAKNTNQKVEWNAVVESVHYGISLVDVSRSTLKWTFVSTSTGSVLDDFTIKKT